MRRTLYTTAAVLCAVVALHFATRSAVPARAAGDTPAAKPGTEIGLDYRKLVREQMELIVEGKIDKAVELLDKHALAGTFTDANRQDMGKQFTLLSGRKLFDTEVVGYKRLSSRMVRVHVPGSGDETAVGMSR